MVDARKAEGARHHNCGGCAQLEANRAAARAGHKVWHSGEKAATVCLLLPLYFEGAFGTPRVFNPLIVNFKN